MGRVEEFAHKLAIPFVACIYFLALLLGVTIWRWPDWYEDSEAM